MKHTSNTVIRILLLALFALIPGAPLFGQGITSAAISGRLIDPNGNALSGVPVRVTHLPTGTVYSALTRDNGRFAVSNVQVGGPFSVTAASDGIESQTLDQVFTSLGQTTEVTVRARRADAEVFDLGEFNVVARSGDSIFDPSNTGVKSAFGVADITGTASTARHLNDIARLNPYVSLTEEDRNELTALGQNSRFNSIMLDGVRINDQFGLNSSGAQSFRNPISFEAIEAITVELSPYDVTRSGFTGAAINAVTKSGTNEFSGSVYGYYYDDSLRGDVNGANPAFEETTWGVTLGGPILKDRLFFFMNYEEFERVESGGEPGFDPDPAALAELLAFNETLPFSFGEFGAAGERVQPEEKFLVKLDWNITDKHRLAVKYQKTEGSDPNVANFDDNNETSLDSHFYLQERKETFYSAQLYSNWTPDFSTEVSFGYNRFRQPTTFDSLTPQIRIDNFPRVGGGTGTMFMGTEQFRHANNLEVDTYNFSGLAHYFAGNKTYTFGVDLEDTSFANLFLESAVGNLVFANLADFKAGVIDTSQSGNYRNTGVTGQNPIAESEVRVTGAFAQVAWEMNQRLSVTAGLRVDYTEMGDRPPVASDRNGVPFEELFGFPNNGYIGGNVLVSPRLSFNYKLDEQRQMQLRGGIGVFQGRTPGVWLTNPYTNNGETSNRINFADDPNFNAIDYLNNLDVSSPIVFIDKALGRPAVDVLEEDLSLPWIVRANLAFDFRLGQESNWVMSFEAIFTENYDALYVYNANQRVAGTLPDDRPLYGGTVVDTFADVYVTGNADVGDSQNFGVTLQRDMVDGWFARLSYVHGRAEDANPFTSSRAVSNWNNRQVFDPNAVEVGRANTEVRHRFLVTVGTEFELVKDYTTTVSLLYEGRTGRPYSVVFNGDINGDGRRNNDLLYIPTGPDDPLVNFAPGFDVDKFFDFIEANDLEKYAGGAAPRNSQFNNWVHRLDLKLEQNIPIWEKVRLTFFVDFINVLNMIDDDMGLTEEFGFPFYQRVVSATASNGKYNYNSFAPDSDRVQSDGVRSRWAIQLGARLSF